MKYNVSAPVMGFEGKPLKFSEKEGWNWKKVIFIACNNMEQGEKMTEEDRMRAYQITKASFEVKDELELSADHLAFLMKRIGKIISDPLLYGRAKEFFEGDSTHVPKS